MGLIQNKVTVSQPNSHVVVKNAGGLRGLTGETGPQGPQGVPGEAATVTAGTTTTLPAGSDATVQNVGSTSAAIFNFGIPKGDKGDTGETGTAATISVGTTTTLEPGEDAIVTNSGTSSAAVFDFGIPKGAKGDTGSQGPAGQDGADGFSPTATVTKTGDTATITITDKDGTTTAQISDGSTPTVNDGTLTIQKNGTTVQTFSADQASNVTANITVPTQFSELSGTVSSSQIEDEAITTGSVSGTGTNITLAGTMEGGAIESVELKGDTTQTTYSGKNLLNQPSSWSFTRITNFQPLTAGTYYVSCGSVTKGGENDPCIGDSNSYVTITSNMLNKVLNFAGTDLTVYSNGWSWGASSVTSTVEKLIITTSPISSIADYEPYVGGTASPNPDYPQEVQTVTGEQTVTVSDGQGNEQTYPVNLGKNLFDLGSNLDNYFVTVGTGTQVYTDNDKSFVTATFSDNKVTFTNYVTTNWRWVSKVVPLEKNTTYTISGDWTSSLRIVGFNSLTSGATGTLIKQINPDAGQYPPATFDSGSYNYVVVSLYPGTDSKYFDSIQIEKGSVATSYAPYFTPIELCKIGTYQDYIYKSGEDWYVKKNTKKLDMSTINAWARDVAGRFYRVGFSSVYGIAPGIVYSNDFTYSTTTWDGEGKFGLPDSGNIWLMISDTTVGQSDLPTWLGNKGAIMYGTIATPTDTQITNATLISELEDLLSATTYSGTTYITVSGDLASPLEVVAEADSKLAPDSVYGAAIKDGAVSTDKIEDGAVTPAKISTSAYQSGETAVGTWIDGKTIYRQVLTGTVQITANNVATVTTTIAAKSIVSTSGWYQSWKQNDTTSNKVAFGQLMGNNIYSYALIRSGNYIELGFISSVNVNSQYEVVVEYTKKD